MIKVKEIISYIGTLDEEVEEYLNDNYIAPEQILSIQYSRTTYGGVSSSCLIFWKEDEYDY